MAYDHDAVLKLALSRLRTRARYTTLLSQLMPKEFTLTELEAAYECVLGTEIDKRNFRKKIAKLGILKETTRMKTGGRFRPARLYRFNSSEVKEIEVL
jgi:8-oxo-dGTP diphosphatase